MIKKYLEHFLQIKSTIFFVNNDNDIIQLYINIFYYLN